ncbi:MAG: hypothetical protein AB1410_06065 [Acidobacteriota bacterium]
MKKSRINVTSIFIFGIVVAVGLYFFLTPNTGICEVCGRKLHSQTKYVLHLKNGDRKTMCCPTCGIRKQMEISELVEHAEATDYLTKKLIYAQNAYFLEGSDVNPCAEHIPQIVRDQYGMTAYLCYDRCKPGLIAFKNYDDVINFQSKHGGEIKRLNYEYKKLSLKPLK